MQFHKLDLWDVDETRALGSKRLLRILDTGLNFTVQVTCAQS